MIKGGRFPCCTRLTSDNGAEILFILVRHRLKKQHPFDFLKVAGALPSLLGGLRRPQLSHAGRKK